VQRVGIRVPRVRVLEYTTSEWRRAKHAIHSKAEAADPTGVDAQKVEKELDRPFIMGITSSPHTVSHHTDTDVRHNLQ
jgi:hypothetical protein